MYKRLLSAFIAFAVLFTFSAPAYASWKTKAFGVGIGFAVKHVIKNGAKAATNSFRTVKGKQAYEAAFNKVVVYSKTFINEVKIRHYVRHRFIPKFPKYERSAEEFLSNLSRALNGFKNLEIRKIGSMKPINGEKYANKIFHLKDKGLASKYPNGVPFNSRGFPNFSEYSIKNKKVVIKLTNPKSNTERAKKAARSKDFRMANKKSGYRETPNGYTWHHNEDIGVMELVKSDIHSAVKHTGGFAINLNRIFPK